MSNKKKYGQFYTTNYDYILQNMTIPDSIKNVVEPFAGNNDLLPFIKKFENVTKIICYDIDPKNEDILKQDTITNPPSYEEYFIVTNPPYLARNKSTNKKLYDKYDVNDLYKCLIKELCTNVSVGGILIIPLNFWSSIRENDINLRKQFLSTYDIVLLNIFEEKVFEDTSYTICSFQFIIKTSSKNKFPVKIYPSKQQINANLTKFNNYMIGGDIYKLNYHDKYKVSRVTTKNIDEANTTIVIKCIDDNLENKIKLFMVKPSDIYVDDTPRQTARTYATLIIEPAIDEEAQILLVDNFNNYLEYKRKKYNSLFLTNYRESKDIARKRISFDLVYSIVKYMLCEMEKD